MGSSYHKDTEPLYCEERTRDKVPDVQQKTRGPIPSRDRHNGPQQRGRQHNQRRQLCDGIFNRY